MLTVAGIVFARRYILKLDLSESEPTPQPVGPAIYGYISGIIAHSSSQHTQGKGNTTMLRIH